MADQFTLDNIDGLLNKMKQVDYEVRKKGGRFALRKAAQVVRDAARANALRMDDSQTGRTIAGNVAERWNGRLNKRTGDLGFRIGVMQGAVLPAKGETPNEAAGGPTPHWRLVEFGTEKMAARPFMRPAMESNIPAVTSAFITNLDAAIDRAIKRNGKPS